MMMHHQMGPTALPQSPQSMVNWDQEFTQVADDVKGKGKARLVEVDQDSATGIEDAFRQLSTEGSDQTKDDFLSDFEKYVSLSKTRV